MHRKQREMDRSPEDRGKKVKQELYHELTAIVGTEYVLVDEPMKKHTTFRIGGPADFYVLPHTSEEIEKIIDVCTKSSTPYYILGNGSNLLVSDKGYRGVVLQIFNNLNQIEVCENRIKAQAGALLSRIAWTALEQELTGFEFAAGIPGTLGGAAVMNAGAYGGEMKDVLKTVTVLTGEGKILTLKKEELELGYRTSIISRKQYIVLEAEIELQKGQKGQIREKMDELKEKRTSKQPLEFPSAGSTFKRPEGYFAGKLIMDAGLRGFSVGDAQVSEKHCGFVINKGEASAEQVYRLIGEVSARVEKEFGVRLEPEVKMLGEFS